MWNNQSELVRIDNPRHKPIVPTSIPPNAADRVAGGLLAELERGRIVPGQRLVETEIAARFGVGRNAVREAMQHLAARGVIDLVANRSPAIRLLTLPEALDVLAVARVATGLLLSAAAARHDPARDDPRLAAALTELTDAARDGDDPAFSRARRRLYRILLGIAGNRELMRLFPGIATQIVYAQYRGRRLRDLRLADYREMVAAVRAGDAQAAERIGHRHCEAVARVIAEEK